MQIALFGGTFDPPHLGHYQVVKELLQRQVTDAVWFVPVKNHPFAKKMTAANHRLAMLEILVAELQNELSCSGISSSCVCHPRAGGDPDFHHPELVSGSMLGLAQITIERYEIDHPSMSYSFSTLTALSQKYPQHTFSWVIGADNLAKFSEWHDYQKILQQFSVYVYPRQGFAAQPIFPGMIYLSDFPEVNVSASEVREKWQHKQSIDNLVLPAIQDYIQQNRLYQINN